MSVTVYFEGICTHVRKDEEKTPWLEVPHRVVLANARQSKHDRPDIPDHEGTLYVDADSVQTPLPEDTPYLKLKVGAPGGHTWNIYGATVSIPSADDPLEYCGPACMPPLAGVPDFVPDKRYLDSDQATADTVDFFFDIEKGELRDCCFGDAYGAKLHLTKAGADPSIVIRPFGRGPESRIRLKPKAKVVVRHTAARCTDDDLHHYLLHYLIGGSKLPKTTTYVLAPCRKPCPSCMPGDVVSLGVGCSSSNFP